MGDYWPTTDPTPGPGSPRVGARRAQRERLLAAMATVVAEIGYEDASVEQVLTAAGMSRRTFYELFDDREDCFVAAYDAGMRCALRRAVEAYLECEDPRRGVESAIEGFLSFCADEPDVARMCIVEVFAAGPRARRRRAEAMDRLTALMEHALGKLRGHGELDRLSARALVGAVHELIYRPIDLRSTDELRGLAPAIVETQLAPLLEVTR